MHWLSACGARVGQQRKPTAKDSRENLFQTFCAVQVAFCHLTSSDGWTLGGSDAARAFPPPRLSRPPVRGLSPDARRRTRRGAWSAWRGSCSWSWRTTARLPWAMGLWEFVPSFWGVLKGGQRENRHFVGSPPKKMAVSGLTWLFRI